ncbi:hypothetical protein PCANC_26905 [Puccinia coronata f. sp. avenae]|uniref:Uncharacterized protein n=1 Tax=Puccinia coronata f. sp. avenae TaxID=200324 RepID=A0A2N5TH27_9BASI|nr:hypothetical protein PCANC_26905 [Puccinia coronata f. sp. avenae]
MPIGPGYQWAAQTQLGSLLGARWALPPGGSNWVVQSRSCLLAPEQTQVPHRPQVPRRRVNNFQLVNVMEPQSSPPAPTPAPAPGSDADILVDDSVSNAPATCPASYCLTTFLAQEPTTTDLTRSPLAQADFCPPTTALHVSTPAPTAADHCRQPGTPLPSSSPPLPTPCCHRLLADRCRPPLPSIPPLTDHRPRPGADRH